MNNEYNIERVYEDLCNLNYKKTSPLFDSNSLINLQQYDLNDLILEDIKNIKNQISSKTDLQLGVISSGTHSLDYKKYYEHIELGDWKDFNDWNSKPVMFVYECPADNLASSFLKNQTDKALNECIEINKKSPVECTEYKSLLCNSLWHLDPYYIDEETNKKEFNIWNSVIKPDNRGNYGNNFEFFEKKSYGKFTLSMILKFKLKNLYTTNFFRYEIFKDDNGKEKALNLPQIMQELNDTICTEVFKNEIKIHQPKVIFATSNPYNWLISNWYKNDFKIEKPLIIKVPHPASRDNSGARFLKNAFAINAGLEKVEVICKETAQENSTKIYERYKNII